MSLKYRIAIVIFLLEAVMIALVLGVTHSRSQAIVKEQVSETEEAIFSLLSDMSRVALFTNEYGELQPYFERVVRDPHVVKVLVLNLEGRILMSSRVQDVGGVMPAAVNTEENYWRIEKIDNFTGSLGKLAVNFSHESLVEANRSAFSIGIKIAITGMLFIAFIGILAGNLITRRLGIVVNASRDLANGDLSAKTGIVGKDEIAALGEAFDRMAGSIERRDNELQKAREQLEERVRSRTEELAVARDEAIRANRTKSVFLANMSHELRTPLNAIIGYSELLLEESTDIRKEDMDPDLKKIRSAGNHLLSLVNNILDLSKIEAGKMGVHLEWFEVEEMVNEVVSSVQPQMEKNSNRLKVELAEGASRMFADRIKVKQTLINLVGNASKFTQDDEVYLRIGLDDRGQKEWLCFEVEDHGIGMSQDDVEHLFEEFRQADTSSTRKYGGTGLGLTISKHFCKLMGGDIDVHSRPGCGSTFYVRLPREVDRACERE